MKYVIYIITFTYLFNQSCSSCKLFNCFTTELLSTNMNVTKYFSSIILLTICSSLVKSACLNDYIGDGYCDDENNIFECNYDGGNYINLLIIKYFSVNLFYRGLLHGYNPKHVLSNLHLSWRWNNPSNWYSNVSSIYNYNCWSSAGSL